MAVIFLDLDGTLTDPAPGILGCYRKVLRDLGREAPPDDALRWVIGPALIDSFTRLGVPDPQASLKAYRACYAAGGIFECSVYDGIREVLAELRAAGHVLHLATAKPLPYAVQITAHFGLDEFLDRQFGPQFDGALNNKGDLLAHALTELGHGPQGCVMVGDRIYDIDAARQVGMPGVAVGWGFGDEAERAGADAVCTRPADLRTIVESLL